MEFDHRALKYPDKLSNNETFESEENNDWDRAFMLARHLVEHGYPVPPNVDIYALATKIFEAKYGKKEENITDNSYLSAHILK